MDLFLLTVMLYLELYQIIYSGEIDEIHDTVYIWGIKG